jgi:hypothetical protein
VMGIASDLTVPLKLFNSRRCRVLFQICFADRKLCSTERHDLPHKFCKSDTALS